MFSNLRVEGSHPNHLFLGASASFCRVSSWGFVVRIYDVCFLWIEKGVEKVVRKKLLYTYIHSTGNIEYNWYKSKSIETFESIKSPNLFFQPWINMFAPHLHPGNGETGGVFTSARQRLWRLRTSKWHRGSLGNQLLGVEEFPGANYCYQKTGFGLVGW